MDFGLLHRWCSKKIEGPPLPFGTSGASWAFVSEDYRAKLEGEIQRLEDLHKSLDKDWAQTRYLFAGVPLAFGLYPLWGVIGVVLGLFLAFSLVATSIYLITVRRREYLGDIEQVREDLLKLDLTEGRITPEEFSEMAAALAAGPA